MCFNPCSLGCCSERRSVTAVFSGEKEVSILVLLDVALKVIGIPLIQGIFEVSILVLLDVALKGNPLHRCGGVAPEFQSLFSWMLL